MQGSRPESLERDNIIRTIVKDANCRTFVSLQAECLPEEDAILLGDDQDGGSRKDIPKDLPGYAPDVGTICNKIAWRRRWR